MAVEQMAIGIGDIAGFSREIALVSRDMESIAHDGLTSIRNVVAQMDTIKEAVEKSSKVVSYLQEHSNEISSIFDVRKCSKVRD